MRGQLEEQYEAKRTIGLNVPKSIPIAQSGAHAVLWPNPMLQLRNERLTFETDLDLLKEKAYLELQVDMGRLAFELESKKLQSA